LQNSNQPVKIVFNPESDPESILVKPGVTVRKKITGCGIISSPVSNPVFERLAHFKNGGSLPLLRRSLLAIIVAVIRQPPAAVVYGGRYRQVCRSSFL